MSQIQVDNIYNKEATGSPSFPLGANVTGVITATTFKGGAEITSGTISATSVTAASGTFNGPVTIGGTLTYEDVTNIDSVGVITARNGINVSGGTGTFAGNINANGNIVGDNSTNISGISSVTATNFYGNGASLSGIEAAPTIQGVANGTIASEAAVIVESDGKVAPITPIAANTSAAQTALTDLYIESWPDRAMMQAYDATTGRIAVVYRKSDIYMVVGTRSGNSITWGTPATLTDPGSSVSNGMLDICNIGPDKWFLIYGYGNGSSGQTWCQVATTTSSHTFTVGTRTSDLTGGAGSYCPRVEYDSKNGGVLICYNSANMQIRYATVSGTAITMSAETTVVGGTRRNMSSSYDEVNGYMLLTWSGNATSFAGDPQTLAIYKNSSNGASHGGSNSPYPASGIALGYIYSAISDRYYAFYTKNNNYIYYKIGTESTPYTIAWGSTEYDYSSTGHVGPNLGGWFSAATDLVSGKIFIQYERDSIMRYQLHKTNALSVELSSLQAETDWNTAVARPCPVMSMGNMAFTYGYNNVSAGSQVAGWQIKQFATTDMTTENFIGFSKAAYTNGQTATVKVVGNVATKSGLTPGKKYYVQQDGTVSITESDPSVVAGRALTATSLLIQPV